MENNEITQTQNPLESETVGKLILIFPLFWGIDGVLWAGPIADRRPAS